MTSATGRPVGSIIHRCNGTDRAVTVCVREPQPVRLHGVSAGVHQQAFALRWANAVIKLHATFIEASANHVKLNYFQPSKTLMAPPKK